MTIKCCEPFEKGMRELTAQQMFCANQSAAPLFTAPQFKFCPWCAKEIIREERRKENRPVEIEKRKDINLSSNIRVNNGFPINKEK